MKSVLLAMAAEDHDKRSWRCLALVATFVLLSLAVNGMSREQASLITAINGSDNILPIFLAAVTVGEMILIASFLHPTTPRGDLPCKEALAIVALAHLGGAFLRDFQRSQPHQDMSLAVTFLTPVLALLAILSVTSTLPRVNTWVATAIISTGCIFMTLNPASVSFISRPSLISSLSIFSFILRNVVIKHLVTAENVAISPRGSLFKLTTAVICVLTVCLAYILGSAQWVFPTVCAVITSWLSAILFYVNSHLLRSYNVLFVSVFQTWALLVEALVITSSEHRPELVVGLISIGVVLLGHYFFFKDHMEHGNTVGTPLFLPISKANTTHEQYTRVEFLLFSSMVVGIIFYIFQPSISQRDLDNLSLVGLDGVFRKVNDDIDPIK